MILGRDAEFGLKKFLQQGQCLCPHRCLGFYPQQKVGCGSGRCILTAPFIRILVWRGGRCMLCFGDGSHSLTHLPAGLHAHNNPRADRIPSLKEQ